MERTPRNRRPHCVAAIVERRRNVEPDNSSGIPGIVHREPIRGHVLADFPHRQQHPERKREYQQRWVEQNRDKIREYSQRYYKHHRDEVNARAVARRDADPERTKQTTKAGPNATWSAAPNGSAPGAITPTSTRRNSLPTPQRGALSASSAVWACRRGSYTRPPPPSAA
ncbi:hypothetical protein [Cryobacterium melibiosiphilum]|uniref:hypothetical protein n=1 Tax=Cryobacterium melibiosiphilum TaxID=995039 RepID=UPI0011C22F87|nr:hypothetical protein [Cryobacterium melibiosiphilum]